MENSVFVPVPAVRKDLLQELSLEGMRWTESRHPGSKVIRRHAHRMATVNILIDGSFEESYPQHRDLACEPTSVLVRPAGADHIDRLGDRGACNLVLEVADSRLDSIREHCDLFDRIRVLEEPVAHRAVREIRRELAIQDGAMRLALESLALELLSCMARALAARERASHRWMKDAVQQIHDRFRDPGLRFRDLAREAEVHPVYFARAFRAAYGASPGEYLRRLRVDWAADQIRYTDRPLADIAVDAGFADQSHLSRVFKAFKGWTPAAWRRFHL